MVKYGAQHRALRQALLPLAPGSPCTRCGRTLTVDDLVDLDHTDDRTGYLGWAHASCNRRAGAIRGNKARGHNPPKEVPMNRRCSLGVDIAFDRDHTSAVFATELDDGVVLVELEYLDGADTAVRVARLAASRPNLTTTAIDPRSPATTLLAPLRALRVEIVEPDTKAIALAHGQFLDGLRAGRIRYVDHPSLTGAVQHAFARPLAGSQAIDRHRVDADASPFTAAELAVWALLVGPPDNTFRGGFSSLEDHLGGEGASTFGPGVHITSATISPGA